MFINTREFIPIDGVNYKNNYIELFKDIKLEGKQNLPRDKTALATFRDLISTDLFFIVNFIIKVPRANHPFVVNACREVEDGPKNFTLDIWAREHFKSSCISIAETIQYTLLNPNNATGIFAYALKPAKQILFSLKSIFEREKILALCFPDVVFEDPWKNSPLWSIVDGLVFNRESNRALPNISAYGLTEGMPTGAHFDRMVYDDIVTEDLVENPDMMEKIKLKFDSSRNLGSDGSTHRVIGTFYHYDDPLMYIRNKKSRTGESVYKLRLKSATDDGTPSGKPVLLSEERLEELKSTMTFNCQQLLDPSPIGTKKLSKEYLTDVETYDMPPKLHKFLIADPAGQKGTGDPWAIMAIGVNPHFGDVTASEIYILDLFIEKMELNRAIREVVNMYCKQGKVLKIGVEELAQSTFDVHISTELNNRGYHGVTIDNKRMQIFRPSRRHKTDRILQGLSWPLENGKLFISTTIPIRYRDMIRAEIHGFPYSKDDHAIDALSYFILDMLPDCKFRQERIIQKTEEIPILAFC